MLLAEQDYSFLFNLDAQLLFDTLLLAIAVFFLFLAMSYLLFNPARKMLRDRQNRIEQDIDSAKEDKESAAALKAEYEGKLKEVDKEAEAILAEARQKAIKNEAKIIDEAKEEASRIRARDGGGRASGLVRGRVKAYLVVVVGSVLLRHTEEQVAVVVRLFRAALLRLGALRVGLQ